MENGDQREAPPQPESAADPADLRGPVGAVHPPAGPVTHNHVMTPGDHAPDLADLIAWLDRLAESERARSGQSADSKVLAELERVRAALSGTASQQNALDDLRRLIAAGVVGWPAPKPNPEAATVELVAQSLMLAALWPLAVAPKLPDGWVHALRSLTSHEIARLLIDVRTVYPKGDHERLRIQFARSLANPLYAPGALHLLEDLRDTEGGWPAVAALKTAQDGQPPEPPRDARDLLRKLAPWLVGAAIGGIVGNRADDLLTLLWEWLTQGGAQPATAAPIESPPAPAKPQPAPQPVPTRTGPAPLDEMLFCFVPAGPFWMGSDPALDPDAEADEKPQHKVRLSEYYVGQSPITVAQFLAFADETRHRTTAEREGWSWTWNGRSWEKVSGADWRHPHGPGSDVRAKSDHPATCVSWDDAVAFCEWLTRRWRSRGLLPAGWSARLPTEAEWEKAARGGQDIPARPLIVTVQTGLLPTPAVEWHINPLPHRRYPWGDQPPDRSRCNIDRHVGDTTPVGRYSQAGDSPYGCADLASNVWDWCADWYAADEYSRRAQWASIVENPRGPQQGEYRVVRGGSWGDSQGSARSSYRDWYFPVDRFDCFGFRVVSAPIR